MEINIQVHSNLKFSLSLSLSLQLIRDENVKGVVSMNEDYELWMLSNNSEVSSSRLCQVTKLRSLVYLLAMVKVGREVSPAAHS